MIEHLDFEHEAPCEFDPCDYGQPPAAVLVRWLPCPHCQGDVDDDDGLQLMCKQDWADFVSTGASRCSLCRAVIQPLSRGVQLVRWLS